MEWFIFALLAAVFHTSMSASAKHFMKRINRYYLTGGLFFIAGIFLTIISYTQGFPTIKTNFWYFLPLTVFFLFIAAHFYYKALEVGDISLVVPMLSFTPLFMIVTSFLILGESPSPKGMLGIMLIVAGSYIMHFKKNEKLFAPFKSLYNNKGTRYALIVALIYSVSGNIEKILINNSDIFISGGLEKMLTGVCFFAFIAMANKSKIREHIPTPNKKLFLKAILITGLFSGLITLVQFTAMTMTIVPYVIAIKRTTILFSMLAGFLFFKEKNISQRFLGAVIMILGVCLIIL